MATAPTDSIERRAEDPRIPPIGSISQTERMFRVSWVENQWLEGGRPFVAADFVARQGQHVRLLDLRPVEEMPGALGYIPGVDWVPQAELDAQLAQLGADDPIVLISRSGYRAGECARVLAEQRGFRFVAAMHGGMWAWRDLGFATSRDEAVLTRRGRLRVIGPAQWEARKAELTLAEVEEHLGDPLATRWLKLAALLVHGRASCVDGRDATGVLGTPGGDAGEFALALASVEAVTGRPLTTAQIEALLARRVAAFGRFYIHSDVHAANTMIKSMRADRRLDRALERVFESLEWRRFFREPPAEVRELVLEHLLQPAHLGCGHLRLMLQDPDRYGVRRALVTDVLRTIFRTRWSGEIDIEVTVLPGGHAEGGVLSVVLEDGVAAFSRIPLVSPAAAGTQLFVSHPQVAAFLRAEQSTFLARQRDVVDLGAGAAADLVRVFAEIGARQAGATLGALAGGLPVFEARFASERLTSVRVVGRV